MSDKQFEPCTLEQATHFEIHGVMHELNDNVQYSFNGTRVGIRLREEDVFIPVDAFPILGIKTLKEVKPKPIEFEATFAKHDKRWHPLYSLDYGFPVQKYKTATFKCVEILEDGE